MKFSVFRRATVTFLIKALYKTRTSYLLQSCAKSAVNLDLFIYTQICYSAYQSYS